MAAGADFEVELDDESDEDDDGWGIAEDYVPNTDDLQEFDYKNTDLNQCGDYELKRHKLNMDKGFSANAVKKGDEGFEYDKRIDFSKNTANLVEDSWDEDMEDDDNGNEDADDYFDDDFA
jgi:hypothetical protein